MSPTRLGRGALALLGCLVSAVASADGPVRPNLVVVLQGLDKVTARTAALRVPIGAEQAYGTLRITPRACLETPPTEPPESAAFLEIMVEDPGKPTQVAFRGWMFASSPSLSALEHPVYDVWVTDCAEPLEPDPEPPVPVAPPAAVPGPAPADG